MYLLLVRFQLFLVAGCILNLKKLVVLSLVLAVLSHLSIADLGSSTQAVEEVLTTLSTTTPADDGLPSQFPWANTD